MCNQMFRVRASRISLFFYSNTEKSSVSTSLNIYRVTLSPHLYILFIFAIFFAHFQLMFCNWRCQREYRPLFVLRGGQTSADIGSGQKPGIIGNKGNRVIHHGSVLQCCRLQCEGKWLLQHVLTTWSLQRWHRHSISTLACTATATLTSEYCEMK